MQHHQLDSTLTQTLRLRYLLHLPPGYADDADTRWPLLLFLHGHGESGDDLATVQQHGLPRLIAAGADLPFLVAAPQCPWRTWWPELEPALLALLDAIGGRYRVDPERVYLTGLSMGGYGSWHLGSRHPGRFAAVAPICGGGYWFHGFPEQVCRLKHMPVWAFHGARDDMVPLSESEQLVKALRDCGGDVRFTIYPEAGHNSWDAAYSDPELFRWFLQHRRVAARAGDA